MIGGGASTVLRDGVPGTAVITFIADGHRGNELTHLVYLELDVSVGGADSVPRGADRAPKTLRGPVVRHDGTMSLLCEYFVAPTDDDAAATIDRDGGPGSSVVTPPPQRRGLFRRAAPAAPLDPVEAYPAVDGAGIEPVVQMGTLEALLTRRTYDEVMESHPDDEVLAARRGGERLVVKLPGALTAALAGATDDDLAQMAGPWSETEEFWGAGDPAVLLGVLQELAGLARLAGDRGHAVYCWVSV